jgi:hypothetical protein
MSQLFQPYLKKSIFALHLPEANRLVSINGAQIRLFLATSNRSIKAAQNKFLRQIIESNARKSTD